MAIDGFCGFELNTGATKDPVSPASSTAITFTGTAASSTVQVRTGTYSVRCNPASGASGSFLGSPLPGTYVHFGLYVATLPSIDRLILGSSTTSTAVTMRLKTTGALELRLGTNVIGTSSTAFATSGWHWVGLRVIAGTSVVFLQIDGIDEITGTMADVSGTSSNIGFAGSEASAVDAYFDDLIHETATFLAPSKVALLLPISDNARGANWQAGAAGTTNLWDAVNNLPPAGVASASETNTTNIKHTGGANNSYDANLTTYSTAGINAGDTVLAIYSFIRHGEDIATGTKLLASGLVSNPNIGVGGNFSAGSDQGAHAAETNFWVTRAESVSESPSVTLGSSPVLRVNRPETASRTACVDFMGAYVAWTPAVAANPPYRSPYPQLLAQ